MATESAKQQQKQNEKIFIEFQTLRNEQRNLANNLSTLEMDLKEHKTVIETLKTVDENRKCFRLIGGVLCERQVKDVLPQLIQNKSYLEKTIEIVTDKLTKKGLEINKFKEEHNVKIHGQDPTGGHHHQQKNETEKPEDDEQQSSSRNVLVTN